ncbi:hypothetical protein D9757_004731 [Collybiopsis confluens]|uniref:Uncharacterized protein n=1 Tax=Collybiopsis confluens TaxID=2823264 RepID=A0A8H5HS45_9AGAR|nr:hypothetical protein D9757_004731 [Collybiopsis confluens]
MSIFSLGMNDVSDEMQAMKDKLSSKEAHIAAQQSQLMNKAAEFEELRQALNEALQKLNCETSRVLQLESSLQRATSDLQHSNLLTQNTSAALASAEERLRQKDFEAKELERNLASLSHDSDGQHSELARMEQEKRKLEVRVRELQLCSSSAPAPPAPFKTPARARSSSLSSVRLSALEDDLSRLRTTLALRDTELHAVHQKLEVVQRDAIRTNNEYMASESQLRNRIKQVEELASEQEEELRYLKDQGGMRGLEREEELLNRIDEDDAKIEALERLVGDAHHLPADQLRKCEERRKADSLHIDELDRRNAVLVQERDEAKDALDFARDEVERLEGQIEALCRQVQDVRSQSNGPDEETVSNMQRLLNAVDRLRAERDGLRRDMEFLDVESKFTIAGLEAKVASISHPVQSSPPTSNTSNLPLIHITSFEEESSSQGRSTVVSNEQRKEIRRLQRMVLGCGIVLGCLNSGRSDLEALYNSACAAFEEKAQILTMTESRMEETDSRLASTIQLLEETTAHRNDALSRISILDDEWRLKSENAYAEEREREQEAKNTADHLTARLNEISKVLEIVTSERDSLSLLVTNLNADVASAKQELAEAESRYTQLQFHQLSDMPSSQATKALRAQIEELEARVMRRTELIGVQQHDIKRLETNLKLQEERLAEMTAEMEMILAQKDAMVEDCADAREQRDEARMKVERLEEEVERLETLLDDRSREQEAIIEVMFLNSARTREKMRVEADRFDELRVRIQSLLGERDTSLQNVRHLTETLEDVKQRLQSSDVEARRMAASLASSQEELTRSLMSTQELDKTKSILSGKVRELELELEFRSAEVNTLTSQLDSLQKESSTTISQCTAEIAELESQLESSRSSLSSTESEHRVALEELQQQLVHQDRLLADNDLEGELVQIKMKHVEELGQLQSRLVETTTTLNELRARHELDHMEHRQHLASTSQSVTVLQRQLQDAKEALTHLKEAEEKYKAAEQHHSQKLHHLEDQLATSNSKLTIALDEKENASSSVQRSADEMTEIRQKYEDRLAETQKALADTSQRLEEECTAMNHAREQLCSLQNELDEEMQSRAHDREAYKRDLRNVQDLHEQAELRAGEINQRMSVLETQIQNERALVHTLQEEKRAVERDTTALEANIQRSLSMNRHLESQIREGEDVIVNLRAELQQVSDHLAKVEKACNTAEVNLSLHNAQHKREVSQLHAELENLKARPNLEYVVSELEERINEMEDLLRKKCEEIEDNDDVKLELMKDNKSLKAKVESLTRKVNNLQTKLAAAKATLPAPAALEQRVTSASSASSSASPPLLVSSSSSSLSSTPTSVPSSAASTSRPRSNTLLGTLTTVSSSSNAASAISGGLNRVVSGPSALSRPKTPERRTVLGPVFKAMSPKKDRHKVEPPAPPAVQNKKRRAPDDFEGYEIPPQVYTAESLPGDTENIPEQSTPKVRRVLSNIQSGFTPARNQTRPTIPMPSPKRVDAVFMKAPAAAITPNSATLATATAADGKKRSWLGKIRGASATTQRDLP